MSIPLCAACFDASALVKRYLDEPGSESLRQYWRTQPTRYTTYFCLYESLGILKRHRLKGAITKERYLYAASDLGAWFRASHSRIEDLDFTDAQVFADAKELANHTDLDLSDAFQLLSLQSGYFSVLVGGSASRLVTADADLAAAARRMKLPVWDCVLEPIPVAAGSDEQG